jgi:hypothetical protein
MHIGKKEKETDILSPLFNCQIVMPGEATNSKRTAQFSHLARNEDQKPGFSVCDGM